MKHFGIAGDPAEVDVDLLATDELKVTTTGQISTSLGGKMIFDVNKEETELLMQSIRSSRKDLGNHFATVLRKAKEVSGFVDVTDNSVKEVLINGRYQRDGYTVALHAIKGEGDYAIPILLFVPDNRTEKIPAIIYLHPAGKSAEASPGREIETLVRQGYIVAALDPLGVGESKNTATRALAPGYTGVMIGRSVVAIQANDIIRVARYLHEDTNVDEQRIGAVAKDEMCLPLIHAAAFEPMISNVTLIGSLISYRAVAMNRLYRVGLTRREGGDNWHPYEVDFNWGIAGVLTAYDLPDLVACIAPRKVAMFGSKDQMLEQASADLINSEMEFPKAAYAAKNVSSNLRISQSYEEINSGINWCFEPR